MKITKMLILVLTMTLLSCCQDEELKDAQESSFRIKDKGLSEAQVDQLKADCEEMSKSAAFLTMRAKAEAFGDMLNNESKAEWTTRSELETYLNANLNETQYSTIIAALADFDALNDAAQKFYKQNDSFFFALAPATPEQIEIITVPIFAAPDVPQTTGLCYVDCLLAFADRMSWIEEMYQTDSEWDEYVTTNANANHVAGAETFRSMRIRGAVDTLTFCFGECAE